MVRLNRTAVGLEVDQIPGASFEVRGAAAIENDGEIIGAEICDDVAVCVAVEIETDARIARDDFLENLSAQKVAPCVVVLKKRIVVEDENRIALRNEGEDLL